MIPREIAIRLLVNGLHFFSIQRDLAKRHFFKAFLLVFPSSAQDLNLD